MPKPKKRQYRTDKVKAAIVAEAEATTITEAGRAHGVSPPLIRKWSKTLPGPLLAAARAELAKPPAPVKEPTNGHALVPTKPPALPAVAAPPVEDKVQIIGLTRIVRDTVRADLRTIVREELEVMFGKAGAP